MVRTLVLVLTLPLAASAADPEPLRRLGSDRFRQAERVEAVAYSPDGKRLATADEHAVYLWDAADGRPVRVIAGAEGRKFVALRFNADATALYAVAVTDRKATVLSHLDPATGKPVATADLLPAGDNQRSDPEVRFSPDGAWVAAVRADGQEVGVMNTATRKVVWSERQADERYRALAFRPDGRELAVGGPDGQVHLVDLTAARVTRRYPFGYRTVWHLNYSPDGKALVATASTDGATDVVRFDAASGEVRWRYQTPSAYEPRFLDGGAAVVYYGSAKSKAEEYRWHWLDAASGKPLDRTMDIGWPTMDVRPDGKVMAVGGYHGHVSQWDLTTRKRLADASADPPGPVTEVRYSADGARVRGWANGWYEWDVKSGEQTRLTPAFEVGSHETVIGSPDLRWRARRTEPILLTEVATGRDRPFGSAGEWMRFLADGRLAVLSGDGLTVSDPGAGGRATRVPVADGDLAVAASDDGTTAVVVSPTPRLLRARRWDLATGKRVGEWEGRLPDPTKLERSSHWRAELSPDGRVLAVFFNHFAFGGMGFNDIHELHTALFDARTGRYLSGWWDVHFQADLAFSPDGRTVAGFYRSGLGVDVREVATGLRRVRRSNPPVHAAAFSPDGRTLALATQPGPVALWDLVGKPAAWDTRKPADLWAALAGDDAGLAFDAVRHLRHHPPEAVALLKERVRVPAAPAADWIATRIKTLDAAQFRDRERATADLAGVGEVIVPELRAALKPASAEARRRLDGLIEQAGAPTPEVWRAVRACEALEGIGTPEARELLAAWAKGPAAATLTREAGESAGRLAERGR